ncbi:hypothetical protein F1721_23060 [Saccharopolyspora hirsuta]|uniref:Uncharacterized protein n=1 Tax=Saccharopolyspora hirsuta TaxID=1837 RepID=A0A5M7BPA7_SACHI|nr:hypothetical protein [Saccharopolyspora hirsuta]KAA5829998.1 hypothetical protein F1721_23060 [Saccharopolyspora hirsuta]
MWLDEVPGRIDPRSRAAVEQRWRRARTWLRVAALFCVAELVLSVLGLAWSLVAEGSAMPVAGPRGTQDLVGWAFAAVLVVLPIPAAVWLARRAADGIDWRRKPHGWHLYSAVVAPLQALGLLLALISVVGNGVLSWWQPVVVLVVGTAIPVLATEAARRAVLRPPLSELGGSEFVLRLPLRSPQGGGEDSLLLTEDRLRLTVRTAAGRPARQPSTKDIELSAITEVGARPSTPEDRAWAWLADGRGVSVPPGDVVVVRTRHEEQLLPVDPEFADVLSARVAMRGRAPVRLDPGGC